MYRQLMLLAVIAAVYSVAKGLKCKKCQFEEIHSDNSLFNEFYPKPNDTSCRDSVDTVEEELCESEDSFAGRKVVCEKALTGGTDTQDGPFGKITVTYKSIMRGCLPVMDGDRYSIGCHDISEFPEVMEALSQGDEYMVATYEGQMCFCDSDNCNSAPGGHKAVTLPVFVLAAVTTILI